MSHGTATPTAPRDPRLKDGWRAAAAAYRQAYGEHSHPHRGPAHEAIGDAIEAMKKAVPGISDREAMLEAIAAVHYASWAHPKWLYALYRGRARN